MVCLLQAAVTLESADGDMTILKFFGQHRVLDNHSLTCRQSDGLRDANTDQFQAARLAPSLLSVMMKSKSLRSVVIYKLLSYA